LTVEAAKINVVGKMIILKKPTKSSPEEGEVAGFSFECLLAEIV
jgi:hypothetical protein